MILPARLADPRTVPARLPTACRICPLPEAERFFCRWPHRCLFRGDGVEAWLVGLTSGAEPITAAFDASLTLTVTFGEADVMLGADTFHLCCGQTMPFPPSAELQISCPGQADLLLLLSGAARQPAGLPAAP